MNRFNRDYAVVSATGRVLLESNNADRCETLRRELAQEGSICSVVKSDLPRSRKPAMTDDLETELREALQAQMDVSIRLMLDAKFTAQQISDLRRIG